MTSSPETSESHPRVIPGSPEWARRINNRWIVHHGLRETTEMYLDFLEETDAARLGQAAERAQQLLDMCEWAADPKPAFYAGLFSVATTAERQFFLEKHAFLRCLFTAGIMPEEMENAGVDTVDKIRQWKELLCLLEAPMKPMVR